ncbi:glycosyltransferase [Clostridium tertium]|uniref:Glycosyltransferase EpsH n=1 Tax=Clostridium tertium TaxID=1559 RepID=A0A6N2ZQR3_9CLOT
MITIILPIYNVEKYLEKSLKSILDQSYKDYELIVVDDGSTDKSLKILNKYKSKFQKIRIFTQDNIGVSEARNLALSHAKGDYILFVDSDDFLKEDMVEKMACKAKESQSDIVISNYYLYYEENKFHKAISDMPNIITYQSGQVVDMMLRYKFQGQLWNKLFKHSLLKENDFSFEKGRYIQDIFPVFKVINKAKKITYIDDELYFYRQREGSTVNKRNKKLTEDFYHAMTSIINYIEENEIDVNKKSLKIFKSNVFSYFIYHYTNEDLKNNYRKFKKSQYKNLNMNFSEFLFLKGLSYKDKLRVGLWKMGLFNIIKKVKRKYE